MEMTRTRVKICGITRREDAEYACQLGVDALGFVFVPASQRYISPADAQVLVQSIPSFVTVVGLFLDEEASQVSHALELIPGMLPQFHGRESDEYCDSFQRPYIKAMGVGSTGMPSRQTLDRYTRASGFLFDSNEPGALGGTGHAFDWSTLGENIGRPLILAGGLDVNNVTQAVETVAPYALDVSSGVESAKGVKSQPAMQQFMRAVREADALKNQENIGQQE